MPDTSPLPEEHLAAAIERFIHFLYVNWERDVIPERILLQIRSATSIEDVERITMEFHEKLLRGEF